MLTRFKVKGFKNLVDVDIEFGPFTCIAGANGVGKSNLFDAISFLSALAEMPLMEAARSVRNSRTADVANLFHRVGGRHDQTMSFTAEMIVPKSGADDLGQPAEATITFLRYSLSLTHRKGEGNISAGSLMIDREELDHININESRRHLPFPHSKAWRDSAVIGRRTVPFISTLEDQKGKGPIIQLHQDRGGSGGGRPAGFLASTLPRSVLSSVNAAENRTAVLARRELQSWRQLQLEPGALREPDSFATSPRLESNGSHLAATLHALAHGPGGHGLFAKTDVVADPSSVYARVANRLAELINDVREVGVQVDDQRELWTVFARGKDGTIHPARSLSDGTLRFLALTVIELDPAAQGVLCLEEPENGIHPERIPAMLRLLKEIAGDTSLPIDQDNPLRQVIINTHSPVVVGEIGDADLVIARLEEDVRDGERFQKVRFVSLPDTWRANGEGSNEEVSKGDLLVYLSGPRPRLELEGGRKTLTRENGDFPPDKKSSRPRRVIDRPDMQQLLKFGDKVGKKPK